MDFLSGEDCRLLHPEFAQLLPENQARLVRRSREQTASGLHVDLEKILEAHDA